MLMFNVDSILKFKIKLKNKYLLKNKTVKEKKSFFYVVGLLLSIGSMGK